MLLVQFSMHSISDFRILTKIEIYINVAGRKICELLNETFNLRWTKNIFMKLSKCKYVLHFRKQKLKYSLPMNHYFNFFKNIFKIFFFSIKTILYIMKKTFVNFFLYSNDVLYFNSYFCFFQKHLLISYNLFIISY